MADGTRRILLGHIGPAHGIRGEVLIRTHTADSEDIASYGPLTDETGKRSFVLKSVRGTPKGVVARIDGVNDRNAAEALTGTELYVARDRLPDADDGSYYHADLIGLDAMSEEGTKVGHVLAMHNFGAGDIIEIALDSGAKTELLPFRDAFVPVVDIAGGRVVVRLAAADPSDDDGS